jgi:hypothetical protein
VADRPAVGLALAAIGALAAGTTAYLIDGGGQVPIVAFELAGSLDAARDVVGDAVAAFRTEVDADRWFLPGYTLAVVLGGITAGRVAPRWLAVFTIAAGIGAGALDLAENLMLYRVLDCLDGGACEAADAAAMAARRFALAKFALVIPAGLVATWAVGVTLWRALRRR